jgi:hypothetical protein
MSNDHESKKKMSFKSITSLKPLLIGSHAKIMKITIKKAYNRMRRQNG